MQTEDATQSRSLLLHGRPEPPVEPIPLRAGDLDLFYEDGALRLIRRGAHEVVRSIYAAVRDGHWHTVPGKIRDERIEQNEDSFAISYRRDYDWNGVTYTAQCQITGDAEGVAFSFHGTAGSEFQRNRIGICVLHPVRECAGVECTITTPEGASYEAAFPVRIQHDQPFLNIKAMRWPCDQDATATLEFEGDVFETEDQRNYADASYKTYSTPQSRPKPVAVHPGDEVKQRVTLHIEAQRPAASRDSEFVVLSLGNGTAHALPALGLCITPADVPLLHNAVQAVRALGLSHLRVALELSSFDGRWTKTLTDARAEARYYGVPLDLALTFGPEPERAWAQLQAELERDPVPVRAVLLLSRDWNTSSSALKHLAPVVRAALFGALVGGGTDGSFIEFNSKPDAPSEFDFLSVAAHPQIHLEDNRTITENAAALGDIVKSVRAFTGSHAVHVAPLTIGKTPDPRQTSLFGAVWALSGIKHLAEAGAASVTFGEAAGDGGLLVDAFVYPIYLVLREIWGSGPAEVVPFVSDDPSRVEGILLRSDGSTKILLGNMTPLAQSVRVAWDAPQARVRMLDDTEARRVLSDPVQFQDGDSVAVDGDGFIPLTLPPYATAVLETT